MVPIETSFIRDWKQHAEPDMDEEVLGSTDPGSLMLCEVGLQDDSVLMFQLLTTAIKKIELPGNGGFMLECEGKSRPSFPNHENTKI